MTPPYASVIVPTRNGMPLLKRCLERVLAQETSWPFEVITIDSGSSDGTWELLESLPVRRVRIQPKAFGHGRTRNLGASLAQGQFLIFLVQDAVPADNGWLRQLVAAAQQPDVAGSYGKQLAHPHSHLLTRRIMERSQSAALTRVVRRLPTATAYRQMSPMEQFELVAFTDVCSCIRTEVWAHYPFADVSYGEDMEWAQRVLKAGYAIAYEPEARVYHSHDRSAWYELKRAYADHHLVQKLFGLALIPSLWKAARQVAWEIKDSWSYVLRSDEALTTKARLCCWAPWLALALVSGQYLGARAERLNLRFHWFRRLDSALRYGV